MRAEQDSKLLPYVTLSSGLDLLSLRSIVAKKLLFFHNWIWNSVEGKDQTLSRTGKYFISLQKPLMSGHFQLSVDFVIRCHIFSIYAHKKQNQNKLTE